MDVRTKRTKTSTYYIGKDLRKNKRWGGLKKKSPGNGASRAGDEGFFVEESHWQPHDNGRS